MSFLDQRPFNASGPDGKALLAALLAAYDREAAVRELVLAAGLRAADFPWSAPMSQVWPQVLRKAADQGLLRRLISEVAEDPGSAAYEVFSRLAAEPTARAGLLLPERKPESGTGLTAADAVSSRLDYLAQVERIAPPKLPGLIGRETELAELARFCIEPTRGPYTWWQAEAWAGKSALLSTFVVHPPPELAASRVQIVSFFITGRLAAQDTREAFIQVLLEQLTGLLGQLVPPVLPEATREAFLLGLLGQAAAACEDEGGRLVLVVDGLDEDRSVTTGPDAHSIAGLLPADPPHGMRVIVAGRPNPPIPDDVPDWHQLRARAIIRSLAASPYAHDVKRLSNQELKRLLSGSPTEQDVLGLLTAARGGLSAHDLEDLTEVPRWEIEQILHTATGRTFARRAGRWILGSSPATYLLGHEELQSAATDYLGENRLAEYRNRLHAWAAIWRTRQWPIGSPEYLLVGYYRLLEDLGDLPHIIECAADPARHDRMLDVIGGDAAAMAETRTALDRIAAQPTPDLHAALAIACHRAQLAGRSVRIPPALPAVWATLGHLPRAYALAESIPHPWTRADALARVAAALARAGQHEQAIATVRQAEGVIQSIPDPDPQRGVGVLAQLASALARAGQHEQAIATVRQAEGVIQSIPDPGYRADVLAQLAAALARAGQHEQAIAVAEHAEAVTRSIADPKQNGLLGVTQARITEALARAGQHERAAEVARTIPDPQELAHALADVVEALAQAGQHEQAVAIAEQAEAVAQSIAGPRDQQYALALAGAAEALARAGQHEQAIATASQAEAVAMAITVHGIRDYAMGRVAGVLAGAGEHVHAVAVARSIANFEQQGHSLASAAEALASTGQHEQAIAVARSIGHTGSRAHALTLIADILAHGGQHAQATAIAAQAEATARSGIDLLQRTEILTVIAEALVQAGQHAQATAVAAQAEAAARHITDLELQVEVLTRITGVLAAAGQRAQATVVAAQAQAVAEQAEVAAQSGTTIGRSTDVMPKVAGALARSGQYRKAIAVARSITYRGEQADALGQIAKALAQSGQHRKAIAVARSIADREEQADALGQVAVALAQSGQHRKAIAVARSIADREEQADVLGQVAVALAQSGRRELAVATAEQATAVARSIADGEEQANVLAQLAVALANAGRRELAVATAEQATAVARSIADSEEQANVLAQLAVALANAGNTKAASKVAADLCAAGDWATAARPVFLLAAAAYLPVVRLLTGWQPASSPPELRICAQIQCLLAARDASAWEPCG
jgi:tetratricopeptide (TPR) repeat protein